MDERQLAGIAKVVDQNASALAAIEVQVRALASALVEGGSVDRAALLASLDSISNVMRRQTLGLAANYGKSMDGFRAEVVSAAERRAGSRRAVESARGFVGGGDAQGNTVLGGEEGGSERGDADRTA